MRCAWAAPPRCRLRGPRAHHGVNAHVQGFACEQHATTEPVGAHNVDHLAHNSPLSPVFAEVVCTVGTTPPHVGSSPPPVGGNCTIRRTTRRRHADSQRLMLQNPHRHRYGGRRRDRGLAAAPERSAGLRGTRAAVPVGGEAWPDNEPTRRSKLAARTAHGRARRPENPRVHKQQPAPHSNT